MAKNNNELIQLLKDYIEFLVRNSKSSFAIVYPHLRDSDEVIQEGKNFRNKLREFSEVKDWQHLKNTSIHDKEKEK